MNILFKLEEIPKFISTIVQVGTKEIMDKLELYGDFKDDIQDIPELAEIALEPLLDSLKVYKSMKSMSDIPNRIFIRKIDLYCRGITEIPLNKREKYIGKLSDDKINEDGIFILNIINRIEEEFKLNFLVKLFEAKVDGTIDTSMWKRLVVAVDRTMYSDLMYLKYHDLNEELQPDMFSDQVLGLMSSGLVVFVGTDLGTGHNRYCFTEHARSLESIIF